MFAPRRRPEHEIDPSASAGFSPRRQVAALGLLTLALVSRVALDHQDRPAIEGFMPVPAVASMAPEQLADVALPLDTVPQTFNAEHQAQPLIVAEPSPSPSMQPSPAASKAPTTQAVSGCDPSMLKSSVIPSELAVPACKLRQCESSGNYQSVSGYNNYNGKPVEGAYQFDYDTWQSIELKIHGAGVNYVIHPAQASIDEQDRAFVTLYQQNGTAPWPVCGPRAFGK